MYRQINFESINGEQKSVILRILDFAFIPIDEANADYQKYLAWIANGGKPEVVNDEFTS